MAGAAFHDILKDCWSAKRCIFPYKMRLQDWTSKVSEVERGRSRSDCCRIVFPLVEAIHGVSGEISNLQISRQAQCLVRLEVDIAWSAHSK